MCHYCRSCRHYSRIVLSNLNVCVKEFQIVLLRAFRSFEFQNRYREIDVIRFLFHIHIACNLHRVAHDNGKWWRLAVATGMLSREIDLQRIHNWRNIARLQDMSCLSTIQWISFLIMSKIICSFQNSAFLVLINQLYADSVRCSTKQVFAQSSKNCKNFLTTAKPLKNIFEWTQF